MQLRDVYKKLLYFISLVSVIYLLAFHRKGQLQ